MEEEALYALSLNFGSSGGISSVFVSRQQRDLVLGFCAHSREVDRKSRVLWVTDTFGVTWFINIEHVDSVSATAGPVSAELIVVDSAWWSDVAILAVDQQGTHDLSQVDFQQLEELRGKGDYLPADLPLRLSGSGAVSIPLRDVVWMRVAPAVVRRLRLLGWAPPAGVEAGKE